MSGLLVGYARCRQDDTDQIEQQDRLCALGVSRQRIYLDASTALSGSRPGLDLVLAAVWPGDRVVVTSLAWLARSITDASRLGARLADDSVRLSVAGTIHDPADPIGDVFRHAGGHR